jgi:hypothetical protein
MNKFQNNIQAALNTDSMRPYGKLTVLLNNAYKCNLINESQLNELFTNLSRLRLGNNSPIPNPNSAINKLFIEDAIEEMTEADYWDGDESDKFLQ